MNVIGQCPPKYDLKNAHLRQVSSFNLIFSKTGFSANSFLHWNAVFLNLPFSHLCFISLTKGTCDKLTKTSNPVDLHRIDTKSLERYFLMQVNPITRIPYSCTCSCSSDKKRRKGDDDKNVNKSLLRIRRSPCPQMESVIHCLCLAPHFSTTHLDQLQDHSPLCYFLFLIFRDSTANFLQIVFKHC